MGVVPGGPAYEVPPRGEPVMWPQGAHSAASWTKPMSRGADTVPAMLAPGELIVPVHLANRIEELMERNGMALPGFTRDSESDPEAPEYGSPGAYARGGRVRKGPQAKAKASKRGQAQAVQQIVKVTIGARRRPARPDQGAAPRPPQRPAVGPAFVVNLQTYDNPFRGQLVQPTQGVLSTAALGPVPLVAAQDRWGVPQWAGLRTQAEGPPPYSYEPSPGNALSVAPPPFSSAAPSVVTVSDDLPLGATAATLFPLTRPPGEEEAAPAYPEPPPTPGRPPSPSPVPLSAEEEAAAAPEPAAPPTPPGLGGRDRSRSASAARTEAVAPSPGRAAPSPVRVPSQPRAPSQPAAAAKGSALRDPSGPRRGASMEPIREEGRAAASEPGMQRLFPASGGTQASIDVLIGRATAPGLRALIGHAVRQGRLAGPPGGHSSFTRQQAEQYIRANGAVFKDVSMPWFNGLDDDQRGRYITRK